MFLASVVLVGAALLFGHFFILFLYNGPPNPVQKRNYEAIARYVEPYFSQDWRLFAPNPINFNSQILVRAKIGDGATPERQTPWLNLTAPAIAQVQGRLLPTRLYRVVGGGVNMLIDAGLGPAKNGEESKSIPRDPLQERAIKYVSTIATLAARVEWGDGVSAIQIRTTHQKIPDFAEQNKCRADQVRRHDLDWMPPMTVSADALRLWKEGYK
jgi:hypothetical protein